MENESRIRRQERREVPQGRTLDRLSTVVSTGGRYSSEVQFIGWDSKEAPMVTSNTEDLSPVVEESIATFKKARLPISRIPFEKIDPVNYSYLGNVLDYKDQHGVTAEDIIVFGGQDKQGNAVSLKFGEYSVLNAISNVTEHVWQDMEVTDKAIQASSSMYTLFIDNENEDKSATALLFKPLALQRSNGPILAAFLQETIVNLIGLERLQEDEYKKGYLDAFTSLASDVKKKSSRIGRFINLFMDVDEDTVDRVRNDLETFATRLKLVERTDKNLAANAVSLMNIGTMDLNTLLLLGSRMRDAAANSLR